MVIGQINPKDHHISIWGAGISGLILAYYLKKSGYRITIYERSDRIGGKIQSSQTRYGLVESAANALFLNPDGLEFIRELKLEPVRSTKKLKRYIFQKNRPRTVLSLKLLLKTLKNLKARPPLITDGLSVADFFRPLIGEDNVQKLLSPALSGLYATAAEELHFKSVFPDIDGMSQFKNYWDFFKFLKSKKSKFAKTDPQGSITFEGGMQGLINRLGDILHKDVILNYQGPFKFSGNTIICTDAVNAAKLLEGHCPAIVSELQKIQYQPICTSTVFYKREIKNLSKAFGVLIPKNNNFKSIGIINNRAIFPTNYPNSIPYTFISLSELDKDQIIEDLKSINPQFSEEDIEDIQTKMWHTGLPIYNLRRYLAVKKMHELAKEQPSLAIFGNYVAGISLREMISAAKSFSAALPRD